MSAALHLSRLRVSQLRQFRDGLTLDGLTPGLNIVAGPNEAGKSTLVRALRAAFFERHRSTQVDDLRPWGDAAAAPAVELDFQWAGEDFRLSKSFLAKKRCLLQTPTRAWEGVEAEDHLAQLFGFQFAGKGASKAEHWGIPGLLWVEQGTGQELRDAQAHAREHLHQALQGLGQDDTRLSTVAAELAASRGEALLERFRAERAQLLTGTGKARGELLAVQERVQGLSLQLQECQALAAEQRTQVDRLEALRRDHDRDEQTRPWEAMTTELQAVQARRRELAETEQQLVALRQHQQGLEQQLQWQQQQLAALQQQEHDAQQRAQALAAAEQAADAAAQRAGAVQSRLTQAQADAEAARSRLRRARQADTRRHLQDRLQRAQLERQRLAAALAQAQAAQGRREALQAQWAAEALDEVALKRWRRADAELTQLRAQRDAAATRLRFELQAGAHLPVQGLPGLSALSGQGEVALAAPLRLDLPGLGALEWRPGGTDLEQLADRLEKVAGPLQAELAAAGLADLAGAEARWARAQDLRQQVELADQALRLVAPNGVAALQAAHAEAAAQSQTAEAAWQALSADAPADSDEVLGLAEAEAAEEAASRRAQQAQTELAQAQAQLAAQVTARDAARREHDALQAMLLAPERQTRGQQAQQALLALRAELPAVQTRVERLQQQIASARPEILAQDEARLTRSIEQLRLAHRQRHEALLLLERDLAHAGAQGLDEQIQALDGELTRAVEREVQLQRRARALDLLVRRLEAGRQAALTRMQAPLQRHLDHYVDLLFPGARMAVDEQLAPGALNRPGAGPGQAGPFEALSFGAREQLGLISRFAYADLLRAAGRPTLLILDDALVHSDEQRLAQMKRVVFDAAQRHQLLLFTCHPSAWRDMGVPIRDLLALRPGLR